MRISKIGALCKANKRFTICTLHGEQWLSDGNGFYPLGELPELDRDNVLVMFDVPEDKREKYYVEERCDMPEGYDIRDTSKGERILQFIPVWLVISGAVLLPLISKSVVLFVDKRYLVPFDFTVELYMRKTSTGERYIVAKKGMIACGLIKPEQIGTAALADQLCELGELVAQTCTGGSTEVHQMSFDEEDE